MSWKDSKDRTKHHQSVISRPILGVLIAIVLLILSAIGYYFSTTANEEEPQLEKGVYHHIHRITAWLSDGRHRLEEVKHQLDKVSYATQQAETEQPVHFEFYSTLPAMQVAGHEENKLNDAPVATKPSLANKVSKKPLAGRTAIFLDPKALEEDFARVVPKQGYVLQLATFSQLQRAEHYRDQLKDYKVEIIKAYVGERHLYRVQVGPFSNRLEVQATKKSLKDRGYSGIVRKIQMG